nr:FxsA family protein [Acuticoccus mangrovi]
MVAVPIAEIAVFLMVGAAIGVLPTIALVIITAIIGAYLLKQQGTSAFARLQDDLRNKRMPAAAIGHAITVAIAGCLLLTPGFITDTLGFLLFIPAVRAWLWRGITSSVKVERIDPNGPYPGGYGPTGGAPTGPRVIDLDEGDYRPSNDPSPWREGPGG